MSTFSDLQPEPFPSQGEDDPKTAFIFSEELSPSEQENVEFYLDVLVTHFYEQLEIYKNISELNKSISWRIEYVGKMSVGAIQLLLNQGIEVIITLIGTFCSPVAQVAGEKCAQIVYQKQIHSSWERLDGIMQAISINAQHEKEYQYFLSQGLVFKADDTGKLIVDLERHMQ